MNYKITYKTEHKMKKTRLLLLSLVLSVGLQASADCTEKAEQIADQDFKVDLLHFRPDSSAARTLIIFPPTGFTNYIDRSYAKTFCAEHYNVVILNRWTGDEGDDGDMNSHQRYYERSQKVVKMVLAQTKTPFVGMLGTSLGALFASMSASLYPQINAVFIIVGGAPISSIIADSDQAPLVSLYEKRKAQFNFRNRAEYAAALDREIQLDPLKLPPPPATTALGVIIAGSDDTVPTRYQNRLADFWNPSTRIDISGGHGYVILKSWLFHTSKILQFFEQSSQKISK